MMTFPVSRLGMSLMLQETETKGSPGLGLLILGGRPLRGWGLQWIDGVPPGAGEGTFWPELRGISLEGLVGRLAVAEPG